MGTEKLERCPVPSHFIAVALKRLRTPLQLTKSIGHFMADAKGTKGSITESIYPS